MQLQSLTVSPGTFFPAFNASTTSDFVNVDSTIAGVTVTAQPQDAGATVSINGQTTTNLSVFSGVEGSLLTIQIEVTAPNGNDKTYIVDVTRAVPSGNNNLSALIVSAGALEPTFSAAITTYDVTAPATTENTTVTATVGNPQRH